MLASLDGKLVDSLVLPIQDAGFLYGYGAFETLKIAAGEAQHVFLHLERMSQTVRFLGIDYSFDYDKIESQIAALIKINGLQEAVLNLYLTAGVRQQGVVFGPSQLAMVMRPFPPLQVSQRLSLKQDFCARTVFDTHKTLAYIRPVYEKRHLEDGDDVILYSESGEVLESTVSNVFFVKGRTLFSPRLGQILPGIIRHVLIEKCRKNGYVVEECRIDHSELTEFEELFLTNSLMGIMPVSEVVGYPGLYSKSVTQQVMTFLE